MSLRRYRATSIWRHMLIADCVSGRVYDMVQKPIGLPISDKLVYGFSSHQRGRNSATPHISAIICPWVNTTESLPKLIIDQFQKDVDAGDYKEVFAPLCFIGSSPICLKCHPDRIWGIGFSCARKWRPLCCSNIAEGFRTLSANHIG